MEQFLLFRLGEIPYGLEVVNIQEIVEAPPVHYIPRSPALFLGAMNFHGNILPVLDLAPFLGLPGIRKDSRVIVLPAQICPLALAVTSIHRIITTDEESIWQDAENDFVRTVLVLGEENIRVLDTAKLLASLGTIRDRRK
jgi:purine-binding chemotaxis protein CheW